MLHRAGREFLTMDANICANKTNTSPMFRPQKPRNFCHRVALRAPVSPTSVLSSFMLASSRCAPRASLSDPAACSNGAEASRPSFAALRLCAEACRVVSLCSAIAIRVRVGAGSERHLLLRDAPKNFPLSNIKNALESPASPPLARVTAA